MTDIGSTAPVTFTGIESGLNTEQIMSAYLQIDEAPLTQLEDQQTTVNDKVSAYQAIEQQLQALQTAADQVSAPDAFSTAVKATSSDSSAATATTTSGATPGSTTFSIDQLAAADTLCRAARSLRSTTSSRAGTFSWPRAAPGSASPRSRARALHRVNTQSQSPRPRPVPASPARPRSLPRRRSPRPTTCSASRLTAPQARSRSPMGPTPPSQLATAVETASGGLLSVATNNSGQIVLSTAEQGSQASLQVGTGSANTALGLSAGNAVSGTDGIITVDGQANTVSDIAATGSTVTLNSGNGGTVQADLAPGGLSLGTMAAQNVSVGNGSLASVVSAINASGLGMSAEALDVGENQYALSVSSEKTGAGNDVTIDPAAFSGSGLGSLVDDDSWPGRRHQPRRCGRL